MNTDTAHAGNLNFSDATKRAMGIRALYHKLEVQHHKTAWSTEEDMLDFSSDVGALARLLMASEGRWGLEGDVQAELKDKAAECLWWLLVVSDRLNVDLAEAFESFMGKVEEKLIT